MNIWELVKKYNINPKKVLGQNFLIDNNVKNKILDSIQLSKTDFIVEVGPGLGSLTLDLSNRVKKVIAYEIDGELVKILKYIFLDDEKVEINHKDILKVEISKELSIYNNQEIKVIANLPYYITTPIIFKFLESDLNIKQILIMVQKEVADRMIAKPGTKDYGALSVAVQFFSQPKIMMNVSPKCFFPEPKVQSSVISLEISDQNKLLIKDKDYFFKLVKASFGQRRKTLVNALNNSQYFKLTKAEITDLLIKKGFNPKIRGEELNFLQFADLSNSFMSKTINI